MILETPPTAESSHQILLIYNNILEFSHFKTFFVSQNEPRSTKQLTKHIYSADVYDIALRYTVHSPAGGSPGTPLL